MTCLQPPVLQRALSAHEGAPTSRTSAHLADAPFRFGPDERTAAPSRPTGPGATWTLAETLRELRLRGTRVIVTTMGIRVRHAHRVPGVATAVRHHAADVRRWLDLGMPTPSVGWDDEVTLHAAWLRSRPSPLPLPVTLRPGVRVADWGRFVAHIETALETGPEGPAANAVRRDVAALYQQAAPPTRRPVARRRRALAA